MKSFCLFIALIISTLVSAQTLPVQWRVSAERVGDSEYVLKVDAEISSGWWMYAVSDTANGLDGVRLSWENENLQANGTLRTESIATIINDAVFNSQQKVYQQRVSFTQNVIATGIVPSELAVRIHAYASNGSDFLPIDETIVVQLEGGVTPSSDSKLALINLEQPVADCGDNNTQEKGLLSIFLLGFVGGLIALLTPCVFPMIPVTVSFFTNRSANKQQGIRNGFVYGLYILLIYCLASIPFHLIGNINPQIFNTISTNAWVNLFFFLVFVLFALSFFGLFEIRLPSSIANASGSRGGIFFMALTLAIVSFSCTGPILGSLLVGSLSSSGGAWQLTTGMGGFGLALGLPFALFAMFPQWLKAIPKSGGWMETVKKTLAFVELALAIKFLSNADLVEHWGILPRELFIGAWLIIAIALSLYLLNIKWLLQYGKWNLSKRRLITGLLALVFAIYLVPGLGQTSSANLKLLSGFAPPLSYSIYGKSNVQGKGIEPDVINDYNAALALSQQTGKPLLIDFTGWACVNCRKMEEQVWTLPSVKETIEQEFILVSLYVDDRKKLPEGGTVGEKWAAFQAENFGQVTQPLYVLLSPDEKLLNHPVGYTPKERDYQQWLQCGINAYQQTKTIAKKD